MTNSMINKMGKQSTITPNVQNTQTQNKQQKNTTGFQNIHICCADNYPAFTDIINSVKYTCEKLNFKVTQGYLSLKKDAINIVFAAHKLHIEQLKTHNIEHVIVYNLEQVKPSTPWLNQNYVHVMRQYTTWDYSPHNIKQLNIAGIQNIEYVPLGYTPNLEVIEAINEDNKDIDVLFYGLINERRQSILNALIESGLNVHYTKQGEVLSYEERNKLIARAKIVLNIGYYEDTQVFEIARVSFLMANKVFVLNECRDNVLMDDAIRNNLAFASIKDLVAAAQDYIQSPQKRQEIANKSYQTLKNYDMTTSIAQALQKYIELNKNKEKITSNAVNVTNVIGLPKKLQIGSGKSWRYDFINIDIDARWKPDLVFDLNQDFPFNKTLNTWRFGDVQIQKNYFDYILSEHVFEHIQDLIKAMTTCIELLAEGGTLEIEVPYDLSNGAWQDPTHVRALNENSWLYYTDWYWYIGWQDYRFDNMGYTYGLSAYGQELLTQNNNTFESIRRMPRVIDVMRVRLKKRAVTVAEKQQNQQFFPGFALQENMFQALDIV